MATNTVRHTPGPWEAKNCKILSRTYPHAGLVAHIYEKGNQLWDKNTIEPTGWSDTAQRDANARLIAAAPIMAGAIRAAAKEAIVMANGIIIPRALYDALENALDTATGEYTAAGAP